LPGLQGSGEAPLGILRTATLVSVLGRPMRPVEPSDDGDRKRGRADAEVQAPVPGEPGLEVRGTVVEVGSYCTMRYVKEYLGGLLFSNPLFVVVFTRHVINTNTVAGLLNHDTWSLERHNGKTSSTTVLTVPSMDG
jgi:hypothetical protein